ncbi:phage Gp37/Gp68 family protein [Fusobacterium mortiferum]|nr:phage Gp37/Gp68 family protein [Fusobacterium mortiferum]
MMNKTKIEWTQVTWNPITGCSKISEGCKNCYAERMSKRLKSMKNKRYINGFDVTIHKDLFEEPLKWKSSKIVFVNSMSDIFHELIPDEVILELFKIMNKAKIHIFQVLTKRPERLKKLANKISWTDNIWMGVTVENQKNINRIDILRQTNAHIKFISFEPLLEEISNLNLENIDWAIVGGESGPGAREIKKEWVMSLKEQCRNYNVKFFFKQWGGVDKKKNGRLLDGKEYNEMPNIKKL